MAFLKERPWALGANYHEGALVANYPLDGYNTSATGTWTQGDYAAAPDDASFVRLAKLYAAASPAMATSNQFTDGVTNGAQWYAIYGGMQDWDYIANGGMHLTLEVSNKKSPTKSKIGALWAGNRESMIKLAYAPLDGEGVEGGGRGVFSRGA